jgi:hypothetical protein
MRWLGVWLDSQLTLKEHHPIRLKEGKKALGRLRRLTGQMGLAPVNCWKVMTAYVQSVAMFGSELWWKGDGVEKKREQELQVVVNKQARAVTGCCRTTNLGALAMESGLRPATAQLEAGNGASAYASSACQMATRLERWLGRRPGLEED